MTGRGNQYALVTGATGGVGSAVCERLSAHGILPLVAFRSCADTAEQIVSRTGGLSISLDLSDDGSIDALIDGAARLPGRLVGVAHCASPSPQLAPVWNISPAEMESFWRQNVIGPHRLLSGLVRQVFKASRAGVIVAVTSRGMGTPSGGAMPNLGAYTISKYGFCGVLALFAAEFKWLKVRTVSPGFVDTPMLDAFDPRFVEMLRSREELITPGVVADEIMQHILSDRP